MATLVALALAAVGLASAALQWTDSTLRRTLDPVRSAAVSFSRSTEIVLVDTQTGDTLLEVQTTRPVRDLALSATGNRLLAATCAAVESINLADSSDRQVIELAGADRLVAAPDADRLYSARRRPIGMAALLLGSSASIEWTTPLPGRVRALAVDQSGHTLAVGHSGRLPGVAIVDAATGSVQRSVPLGSQAAALAFTADARTVYALRSDGMLTPISVADGSRGTPIRLGRRPRALTISQDDALLYVLDSGTNTLTAIDRATATPQRTLDLPARPSDMAMSPDGSRLAVTSPLARSLFVIDASSFQIVQTLRFHRAPRRIVFAPRRAGTPQATASVPAAGTHTPPVGSSTPTPTPFSTGGELSSPTPATSPPPQAPSAAFGQVFDDGTAQPLPDVAVHARGGPATATDDQGRYVVGEGPDQIQLIKERYTRAVRRIEAASNTVRRLRDARLTPLAPPVTVGGDGGTVTATYRSPGDGAVALELVVAPGALAGATEIRLTPLSPQGLIAPVPLGWSVLLGVDLQLSAPLVAPATLHIPLELLAPAMSFPAVLALWDDDASQWRAGPPTRVHGDALEVGLAGPATQLAVLVADTLPLPPPAAVPNAPLQGVPASPPAGESALVLTEPEAIVAGTDVRAYVQTVVRTLAPQPSGTRLEVELRELYELRNGQQVTGMASRQDLAAYQVSGGALSGGGAGTTLGAYITFAPSRAFGFAELTQGRVIINTALPAADEQLGAVDQNGGVVSGPGALQLVVPPQAVDRTTVIALHAAAPAALPAGLIFRSDVVAALQIDVSGGTLDPAAPYALGLGVALPDGQRFVIGQAATIDQQTVLLLVALGHSARGLVVLDACPAGLLRCLPGLTGSGTYVVFVLPPGAALATGTVADGSGARSSLAVQSDTAAVVSLTDAAGRYVLPAPAGTTSTLTSNDPLQDLSGDVRVTPTGLDQILTADIELRPTAPHVVQINPPTHGSGVATGATITITLSEPIVIASLTEMSVQVEQVSGTGVSPVPVRSSLSANGTQLLLTPNAALAPNSVHRIALGNAITDRTGTALVPFTSDFTTAPVFKADTLPPNTLRLSLPDESNRVFVCGGAQLALPGTFVAIINDTSGTTFTGVATDASGASGSDVCDVLFPGRCNTAEPGSFCAVADADFGDRFLVQVEDVFHNSVTLDTGLMRDEITGTTAVDTEGGMVFAAGDDRYRLSIPPGAFDLVTLVTVTPAAQGELPTTADASMEFIGGARLDFAGRKPLEQVDLSVPAPPDATTDDQYLATHVINFRGFDELTAVDTAFLDEAHDLVTTDPAVFGGIRFQGLFGMVRTRQCTAYVTGFVALGEHFSQAFVPGGMFLPAPVLTTERTRFTVPVPCNQPAQVSLQSLADDEIDFLSLPAVPRKGEFVFAEQTLTDDKTPPVVIAAQTSIPDAATDVGHDAEVSIPFSEVILSSSIDGHAHLVCTIGGTQVEVQGTWSQSADGKRLFFVQRDGQPLRGLPWDTHCIVRMEGVKDQHGNAMSAPFTTGFTTFRPTVTDHVPDVDAVAVDSIGWHQTQPAGMAPLLKQFIAFAEGNVHRLDSQGGILVQEVTEQQSTAVQLTQPTAGFDFAVRFLPPEELTDAADDTFQGPYLMSVDGPAGLESRRRFGVWRLFDLADFPTIRQVVSRAVNQSSDSFDRFNALDPAEDPTTFHFLRQIPNDLGLPLAVASLGVGNAYIANAPYIGLELIRVQGIDRDPDRQGVDGILRGHFRSVATLGSSVIGGRPDGFVVTDAGLQRNPTSPDYLVAGPQTSVLTLPGWPVDRDRDGKIGKDERFDLVVVSCEDSGRPALCVVGFDVEGETFRADQFEGKLFLPRDSQPFRAFADPERRLLYLANGTLGLTVVDFQDPSGSLDDSPRDGVDDRVLASISLPADRGRTAVAHDVAMDINERGRVDGYIAAREDGWYKVDLGPARMDVHLEGVPPGEVFNGENRIEIAEVRYFNERDSTLYEPAVHLPGHLSDLYSEQVDVMVTAFDANGQPVQPPTDEHGQRLPGFADSGVTVSLGRVHHTNRYALNPDGSRVKTLLVSNLPLAEVAALGTRIGYRCPSTDCTVVYGGIGGTLSLEALVRPSNLDGRVRKIPIEKVGVILLGIDGLRQDVLYAEDDVNDPEVSARIRLDPEQVPGFNAIMGGLSGRVDVHSLRLRGASAIFPSITLASWASVLSGHGPDETGELGNEFFDRQMAAKGEPGVPAARNAPPGMITYSSGAFPGYDTFTVSEKRAWDFVPGDDPDPTATSQNRLWQGGTLFGDLKQLAGYSEVFGQPVVQGNHYARDLPQGNWLTQGLVDTGTHPSDLARCGLGNERSCSRVIDLAWRRHFLAYLDAHRNEWLDRRELFPGLVVFYQMGVDHVAHYLRLDEAVDYLVNVTGTEVLEELRKKLVEVEQFYNKVFIITADHGHTETGATGSAEAWGVRARTGEVPVVDSSNHHIHLGEFVALTDLIGGALDPPRSFQVLRPENKNPAGADLAVAFNGPMAHVYVSGAAGWNTEACQEDRDTLANGLVAALGGMPTAFGMAPDLHARATDQERLQSLTEAIDFVLVRKGDRYVVRRPGPFATPTPTPDAAASATPSRRECAGRSVPASSVQEFDLDGFFAAPADSSSDTYVHGSERIRTLNHPERAGDVVIVLRFRTGGGPDALSHRYTSAGNIPSWHGSLNRSDSYVPFIVSYPGGSVDPIMSLVVNTCEDAGVCRSTLSVAPLVKGILRRQIGGN